MSWRDVLFVVHPKPPRLEFQYALRCLDLIPHNRVWVLGGTAEWLVNVNHLRIEHADKWQALTQVWHDIVAIDDLTSEFIYTEDDYFITKPVDDIPNYTHPKTLAERIGPGGDSRSRGAWGRSMTNTHDVLVEAGLEDPPSFDVHIPMVVEKDRVPTHLDDGRGFLRFRSLIGNTATREPVPLPRDVKVHDGRNLTDVRDKGIGFLSSANKTFRKSGVAAVLEDLFPEPCRYEKEYYMDSSPEPTEDTLTDESADSPDQSADRCDSCGKYAKVVSVRVRSKRPDVEELVCGHRRTRG